VLAFSVMANRRRSSDSPPLQIRQFTPDQGDWAIKLLTPRADEVKALDPKEIPYHDERVRTAERKIRTTILEIFGEDSPEYRDHQYHEIPGRSVITIAGPGSQHAYEARRIRVRHSPNNHYARRPN
jgi:hypothetical protein